MDTEPIFKCKHCDKSYKSNSSLINHVRIKHTENKLKKSSNANKYICKFCKGEYAFPQSRWIHQKSCSKKDQHVENVVEDMIKLKEQIAELQKKLMNSTRLDTKTFKAVNQILKDRSVHKAKLAEENTIVDCSGGENGVGSGEPKRLYALGNEDLLNVLTPQEKKLIIDSRLGSLDKIVEITHCSNLPQYKNIIITNLKDNFAYKYDENKEYFITVSKIDLLEDVVAHRVTDIEAIYDELKAARKVDTKSNRLIQEFLEKIADNYTPFSDNRTKFKNFKAYKIDNIKILLYNNQEKITQDIALMISNSEND